MEKNFRIEEVEKTNYLVYSDSERFGENAITFQGISYNECLDYIIKNGDIQKPSYYIIKDLKTWATPGKERSKIERFSSVEEAIKKYREYRKLPYNEEVSMNWENEPFARLTMGVSIGRCSEIDIIHVHNGSDDLVSDFTRIDVFKTNKYFIEDLNRINKEIGLDNITIYRKPTLEEIQNAIYEAGKKQGLKDGNIAYAIENNTYPKYWEPKEIKEVLPVKEWENPFLEEDKEAILNTMKKQAPAKVAAKNKKEKSKAAER